MNQLSREVRRLALPAILHSCLQTFVFVVDRAMLGRAGDLQLAAMQIAGPLEWSVFAVLLAFEVGAVARVGFYVGAERPDDARAAATASLLWALLFGAVMLVISPLVLARLDLIGNGASPAVVALAGDYLGIVLRASPIVFLAAGGIAVLQASGDTRTPLMVAIVANVVHVPLNAVLIFGWPTFGVPALGMRGAGISTVATFGLEVALLAIALFSTRRKVSLRGAHRISRAELVAKGREVIGVASPSMLERILYHASYVAFVAMIGSLGDRAMAANQVLISIESICFLSADGFGVAAASLVAQKLGARRDDEAARAAGIAGRDAALLLTVCGLLALAFRRPLVNAFVTDPDVVLTATGTMIVLAVAQPFMARSIVFQQSLRGAGRTREVLAVVAGGSVVRLVGTYFFALRLGGGLRGVWWGSTADWVVRAAALTLLFRGVMRRAYARPV